MRIYWGYQGGDFLTQPLLRDNVDKFLLHFEYLLKLFWSKLFEKLSGRNSSALTRQILFEALAKTPADDTLLNQINHLLNISRKRLAMALQILEHSRPVPISHHGHHQIPTLFPYIIRQKEGHQMISTIF